MVGVFRARIRASRLSSPHGKPVDGETCVARWQGLRLGLWLLVMACAPVAGAAQVNGSLDYTGRYQRSENEGGTNASLNHAGTLRLNTQTYLWEPWFAQVNADIGLSLTRSQSRNTGESETAGSGTSMTGRVDLSLFPSSRFPFRLWVERLDSRLTNDNLAGDRSSDRTRTRTGFDQRFRSRSGGSYGFRLEKTVVQQVDEQSRRDERLNWTFDARKRFEQHDLSMSLKGDRARQASRLDSARDSTTLALRHRYTPEESNLSVNTQANANRRELRSALGDSDLERNQVSSTAIWNNAGERRLRLSGSLRAADSSSGAGANMSEQRLLSTSLGASYRYSDRWNFSVNTGATVRESDRAGRVGENSTRQTRHQHSAQARFRSEERTFAGIEHSWDANAQTRYSADDDKQDASASLGVGQRFKRDWARSDSGRLSGQFRQSVSHSESRQDAASTALQNGASLRWEQRLGQDTAYSELQVTDSRQFRGGGLESAFQLVNLQVSAQRRASPDRSLNGNVTLQANRSDDGEGFGDWQPSTSLGVTYNHRGLFGLYRLSWRSDLRYTSDNLLYLVRRDDDVEESQSLRWENRFEYQIGLLSTQFAATVSEADDRLVQSYRLTLSRRF